MSTVKTLRVATRSSALAVKQAQFVIDRLSAAGAGLAFELTKISTRGDRERDRSLAQIGGDGVFVKELEIALQSCQVDFAVHSMKDMPTDLPIGLRTGVVPWRADPRDVLLSPDNRFKTVRSLPDWSIVGTSSMRRAAELRAIKSNLEIKDLRGNIDTRIAKMLDGGYHAIVLSLAGVQRLGLRPEVGGGSPIPADEMVPAVGQGALFIQFREDDETVRALLEPLNDAASATAVAMERAFLRRIGGGCAVPVGAHAVLSGDRWSFNTFAGSVDGKHSLRRHAEGLMHDEADALLAVEDVAEEMLAAGGSWITSQHPKG